jgi:hypothetical protein
MSFPSSRAADTAALLVEPRVSGSDLMIPGSFEVRSSPQSGPRAGAAVRITDAAQPAPPNDRERLEREREGGGAPSQRRPRRRGTIVARLWRSLLHPTALSEIWRYVESERAATS